MYQELEIAKITQTIARLKTRINDRFPDSGIKGVCVELLQCAKGIEAKIDYISKPNRWLQALLVVVVLLFVATLAYTVSVVEWELNKPSLAEVIQITEALINDIVLVGAALFFIFTLENRIKRDKALKELHQLRSLAHIIDMHQLTKDPSIVRPGYTQTPNSPKRTMNKSELLRYLDYCAEMFSLIGKLAAMFPEKLPEPAIVSAANNIETLCTGLSQKVWQKMDFLRH